ncbi:MAG: lamin tail domain-containing protein [bacterium]
MKRISIFLLLFFIIGIKTAFAQIIINEVAWMGTTTSANAEWIELYNTGTESVVLDGWTLKAIDGSPSVLLTGSIGAQGYFLLERTSDETIPQISANQIYSGSLGNNGEYLVLKDKDGNSINEVEQVSGWLAGDNTTKQTMQFAGSNWITGIGTPGTQNNSSGTQDSETTTAISSTTTATSSDPVPDETKKDSDVEIIPVNPDPRFSAKVASPTFSMAGVPVPFSVQVKQGTKKDLVTGRFEWYLGDGTARRYFKNTSFEHVFYYPGNYTVVMEYYSDAFRDEPDSIHKKTIAIVPDAVAIQELTDDGGIVISSEASREIDLYNWTIHSNAITFTFPKYTLIPKKGTLAISGNVLGSDLRNSSEVVLKNPNNKAISLFNLQKVE